MIVFFTVDKVVDFYSLLNYVLARLFRIQGRLASIGILGLGGFVFLGVYFGLLWHSRYLDEYDKRLIMAPSLVHRLVMHLSKVI